MNFKIITEYPWWFILFCVSFGLAVTAILYLGKKRDGFTGVVSWILAITRFLSSALLAFLLVSPMVRTIKRTTVKPAIIFGLDNSASVIMNDDSVFYKTSFQSSVNKLKESLGDKYEIETYNFGERVTKSNNLDYKDEVSDISLFLKEITSSFYNRNVGAVILATDGIYNGGSDPLYEVKNTNYPVYTINMGDTTSRRDLMIQKVNHNKVAYKGNRFPIEIVIHAKELAGERSTLSILDGKDILFTEEIGITSANQVITIPTLIEAKTSGIKRLSVRVEQVEGEINNGNNTREVFIEIRESRLKMAIIAESPHPDIAAIQRVFDNSNNFEIDLFNASDFNQKPENYSLIILHQLPSLRNSFKPILDNIVKSKIPTLFIIGNQTNLEVLNTLKLGLAITDYKGSFNEVLPSLNTGFSAFLYTETQKRMLETVPPLISPFAIYNISNSMQVFAFQVIGSTRSSMPLVMFNELADSRYGIIAGEGIWKWRVYDYVTNNTHENFDELLSKMIQYLTVQGDKSKFRVSWNNFYAENENIEFNAILLNDSYEPVTEPDISLTITDEQKKKFEYAFSPSDQSYNLKVGTFPAGLYTFEAIADTPAEKLRRMGSFVVTSIDLEDVNLVANHKLLNSMAVESGGVSVSPANIADLEELIELRDDVKPVTYSRNKYIDLIDYYPLMILLFLFLGLEWFLRKYQGSY